jgi:GGDEF domain-containing protein
MTNMHPNQLKHSQLPTAHISVVEHADKRSPAEVAMINANLAAFAIGEHSNNQARLIEGWQLATHDILIPQMLNRDGIEEWFKRYRPHYAGVMLLDMRGLKEANKYGQNAGDEVLKYAGHKLLGRLRTTLQQNESMHPDRRHHKALDIVGRNVNDVATARYGGDEFFAVINLDEVDAGERERVMDRIGQRLADGGIFMINNEIEFPVQMHSVYTISDNSRDTIPSLYEQLSPELPKAKAAYAAAPIKDL